MTDAQPCDCPARVVSTLRVRRECPVCGGVMQPLDAVDRRILAYERDPAVRVRRMQETLRKRRDAR